jgi:tetratricopeptide (TPR) repeat protein
MPYLLASTTECAFIGRTHEFLSFADSSMKPVHYDGIVLSHLADGGNRSTQLERDLNLLEDDAVTDPHNPRTMFYLAQTRENIGDSLGAIAAYRARIEMGGWDEEIFWSLYRSARLLEAAGDWPAAAQMYINAWEYRPHRLEPILQLARGYRESGAHRTALIWAELARGMVYPAGDRLFVERWMYDWGMDLELAACLWWNDEPVRASSIWTALLDRDDLSESTREAIRGNLALGA